MSTFVIVMNIVSPIAWLAWMIVANRRIAFCEKRLARHHGHLQTLAKQQHLDHLDGHLGREKDQKAVVDRILSTLPGGRS
jgi:hypothetical protein